MIQGDRNLEEEGGFFFSPVAISGAVRCSVSPIGYGPCGTIYLYPKLTSSYVCVVLVYITFLRIVSLYSPRLLLHTLSNGNMFRFPKTEACRLKCSTSDPGAGDTMGRLTALRPPGCRGTQRALDLAAGTDTWIAAVQHNLDVSALRRLPRSVLLKIMRQLDGVDIFCLRRTCRVFLQLFGSYDFKHLHDKEPFSEPGPWVQQAFPRAGNDWERMVSLLRRDYHYCEDCKLERADPNFQSRADRIQVGYLHCHECQNDHPACLFSGCERGRWRSKRTCIAHEGQIRLCQHKTVKLSEVQEAARNGTSFTCYHPSHIPTHHKMLWLSSRSIFPSMTVEVIGRQVLVSMSYSAHLDLAEHSDGPVTADAFRKHINRLRRGPATYIAPEDSSHLGASLLEMRCFDPNRCRCLLYPGSEVEPDGMRPDEAVPCMDHSASRTLFSHTADDNTIRVAFTSCRRGLWGRCLEATYHRTIRVDKAPRPAGDETGGRVVRFHGNPCSPSWVASRALDSIRGAAAYGWYQALDPDSYALTEDRESFGISWCRSQGCTNYPGHLRENLIQGQKMNPFCSEGCLSWPTHTNQGIELLGGGDSTFRKDGAFWLHGSPRWGDLVWWPEQGYPKGE